MQRTEFFVALDRFLPFYPTNNPRNQNFEKVKKMPRDIIILHKCTKNHDHRLHCSWDKMRDRYNFYFLCWAIFCLFTPVPNQKSKIFYKMKNEPGDIIILYMPTKNNDHMTYGSWDMVRDGQTDRRTDRWTEGQSNWHIEVGVPPKNKYCKNI